MADFAKGFAWECGVSAPLTIEGVEVKGFERVGDRVSGYLPSGEVEVETTGSVEKFVERYVERTGALKARTAAKAGHLKELLKGKEEWNRWRRDNPGDQPMLACLDPAIDFADCPHQFQLDGYDLSYANLCQAKLQRIHLKRANFHQAILAGADLSEAHLEGANFCRTDLYKTVLRNAWLTGANLQGVQMAMTDLTGADLTDCKVYGMSAWDLELTGAKQENLIVKYRPLLGNEEEVVVAGLDLAAFMYLTLNNKNIARVVDAASRQWVLILGRFSEGKDVLEEVKRKLKDQGYIPIIFDFDRPEQRDLTETIILLAGMSAFVIAEISDPRSVALELQAIASNYGVPIFPIMKRDAKVFGMFPGLRKFTWVSSPLRYDSVHELIKQLPEKVIAPAREAGQRLADWKRQAEMQ
jgi:hypothetical protein